MTYGAGAWSHRSGDVYSDADPYATLSTRDDDPWLPVRVEIGYRVREISANHMRRATFDRAENRQAGPHALALLYAEANEMPNARKYNIDIASRLFPWSDDVRPEHNVKDADVLTRELAKIAQRNFATDRDDPLRFTDRSSHTPPRGEFVGVVLSSLGVPGMDWGAMKPGAFGFGIELPAECIVRMVDGTWLTLTRTGRGDWKAECNRAMGYMSGLDWAWKPSIPAEWVPRPETAHAYIEELMVVIDRTYAARKTPAPRQRGGGHR